MFLGLVVSMTLLLSVVDVGASSRTLLLPPPCCALIATPTYIAFSAAFKSDQNIDGGQKIAFNEVFTNFGNCYNNRTGVFNASKGGLYLFNFQGLTISSNDFWIDLHHNDVYLVSAFARQQNDYASAGNSIILRLRKTDTVYLRAHRTVHLYGRKDEVYATFNGYMIGELQ